jgi:hypothetical protein
MRSNGESSELALRLFLRWFVLLFNLLHHNRALGHERGDGADGGQCRQEERSDYAEC